LKCLAAKSVPDMQMSLFVHLAAQKQRNEKDTPTYYRTPFTQILHAQNAPDFL
jgi:hypothetical protein